MTYPLPLPTICHSLGLVQLMFCGHINSFISFVVRTLSKSKLKRNYVSLILYEFIYLFLILTRNMSFLIFKFKEGFCMIEGFLLRHLFSFVSVWHQLIRFSAESRLKYTCT